MFPADSLCKSHKSGRAGLLLSFLSPPAVSSVESSRSHIYSTTESHECYTALDFALCVKGILTPATESEKFMAAEYLCLCFSSAKHLSLLLPLNAAALGLKVISQSIKILFLMHLI